MIHNNLHFSYGVKPPIRKYQHALYQHVTISPLPGCPKSPLLKVQSAFCAILGGIRSSRRGTFRTNSPYIVQAGRAQARVAGRGAGKRCWEGCLRRMWCGLKPQQFAGVGQGMERALANPCHHRQHKRGNSVSGGAEAQRGDSPRVCLRSRGDGAAAVSI